MNDVNIIKMALDDRNAWRWTHGMDPDESALAALDRLVKTCDHLDRTGSGECTSEVVVSTAARFEKPMENR